MRRVTLGGWLISVLAVLSTSCAVFGDFGLDPGSGGADGGPSADGGPLADGGTVTGLSLYYACNDDAGMGTAVKPNFKIVNARDAGVPLSDLTIRYYFTADTSAVQQFACDYAVVDKSNVAGQFAPITAKNPADQADHYLEVSFTPDAGSVGPGSDSGGIHVRFYDLASGGTLVLDQTNDYSFDPTKLTYTPWDHVTLYENGVPAWGKEP